MVQVRVIPYRESWPGEFSALAGELRGALGRLAADVQHIGSTSVPGMPAKDVIDVQVLMSGLDCEEELARAFSSMGFVQGDGAWNRRDHVPEWWVGEASAWDKYVFAPRVSRRACNVHVRRSGAANALYAVLFRDYLRAHAAAAAAFGEFKQRLADRFPEDLSTYGALKDPICDLIVEAASRWANVEWEGSDGGSSREDR